jgi:membrane protein implicated in regulation of membrane protease activity
VRPSRTERALVFAAGGLLVAWAVAALFGVTSWLLLAASLASVVAYLAVSQLRMILHLPERRAGAAGTAALVGATGRAVGPLEPDGRVRIGGEVWRARLRGAARLEDGAPVAVREVRGLELVVEPRAGDGTAC